MTISQGMTYLLAASLAALSARAAFQPAAAAAAYGVPIPDDTAPTPYLEVKANRDLTLAGLLIVTAFAGKTLLAWALFLGAIAPAADAWIVSRNGKMSATGIHFATAAYLIVGGALAISGH